MPTHATCSHCRFIPIHAPTCSYIYACSHMLHALTSGICPYMSTHVTACLFVFRPGDTKGGRRLYLSFSSVGLIVGGCISSPKAQLVVPKEPGAGSSVNGLTCSPTPANQAWAGLEMKPHLLPTTFHQRLWLVALLSMLSTHPSPVSSGKQALDRRGTDGQILAN